MQPGGELRWAARRLLGDPGGALFAASTAIQCARLGLCTGDLATAEEELRRAHDALASAAETYLLAPIAALLVQVVYAQGRVAEAEEIARAAEELAASDAWRFFGHRCAGRLSAGRSEPTRRSGVLARPSS
ncbi:MAG: hypothetical protein ACRDNP_01515 [Gaiellaceae bacterium]